MNQNGGQVAEEYKENCNSIYRKILNRAKSGDQNCFRICFIFKIIHLKHEKIQSVIKINDSGSYLGIRETSTLLAQFNRDLRY